MNLLLNAWCIYLSDTTLLHQTCPLQGLETQCFWAVSLLVNILFYNWHSNRVTQVRRPEKIPLMVSTLTLWLIIMALNWTEYAEPITRTAVPMAPVSQHGRGPFRTYRRIHWRGESWKLSNLPETEAHSHSSTNGALCENLSLSIFRSLLTLMIW